MRLITLEQSVNAINNFKLKGSPVGVMPYGNGHINDTFLVVCKEGYEQYRYILQAVNTSIFPDTEAVISNISLVTNFLRKTAKESRNVLTLVKTKSDSYIYADNWGLKWRVYDFLEDSLCLERPEGEEDFYQCACAFGDFVKRLDAFDVSQVKEIIPNFHNTEKRYNDFLEAVEKDTAGRKDTVKEEIEFVMQRKEFYSVLKNEEKAGNLPLRVTHNDTKCNNVMLDANTKKALCVIDLDTIMPGYSVNDFGDSIRFGASTAAEDEKDLSKVTLSIPLFKAYAKGFIESSEILKPTEIMLLPEGAKMMTIECGMRFLADYLSGDTYFKTAYPEHNLVRARTQFKLVKEMEDHWQELKEIVKEYI